LTVIPPLM